jgi:hypothetical protein
MEIHVVIGLLIIFTLITYFKTNRLDDEIDNILDSYAITVWSY